MAVYTQVPNADLGEFLADYGLAEGRLEAIAQGVENTNYHLHTSDGRYILTLFEDRTDAADLPYFLDLMDHVARSGLPAASPVPNLKARSLAELAGRPAALVAFLPGRGLTEHSAATRHEAGVMLARLHHAGRAFVSTRQNSLGPEAWLRMAAELQPLLNGRERGLGDEIASRAAELAACWPSDLPMGTIHADYFPDNVMFDGGAISGVIDFYFACTDRLAYDLAIAMDAFAMEPGAAASAAEELRGGYESVRPLEAGERAALRVLRAGSALRFFLTRSADLEATPPGALVTAKDPAPYLRELRRHMALMEIGR